MQYSSSRVSPQISGVTRCRQPQDTSRFCRPLCYRHCRCAAGVPASTSISEPLPSHPIPLWPNIALGSWHRSQRVATADASEKAPDPHARLVRMRKHERRNSNRPRHWSKSLSMSSHSGESGDEWQCSLSQVREKVR